MTSTGGTDSKKPSGFVLTTTPLGMIPYFTLASAALVKSLIPSGGGSMALQGSIFGRNALSLNLPLGKMVMLLFLMEIRLVISSAFLAPFHFYSITEYFSQVAIQVCYFGCL